MIRISGLSREVGNRSILKGIGLHVRSGEIFTLIGPSGSGKTSLLRIIDLLDTPTTGSILFDGKDTVGSNTVRLALRRRMAMVFQKPAVLNTTVAENVAYGLKFRGVGKEETDQRVHAALELVGLEGFYSRRAVTLSGGEIQRVAIARAMVTKPDLLLLDEPTANLDPVNSELVEDLILRINRKFHTTIILSTHDMIQGQRLADRIGVIMDGTIVQVGTIHEVFFKPQGRRIAHFVGVETVLRGIVETNESGIATIVSGAVRFEAGTNSPQGQQVTLYIRPEEVTLSLPDGIQKSSVRNRFEGTIAKMVPFGPFIRVTVDCGFPITALITRRSCEDLNLSVGTSVVAGVKASSLHVLADEADSSQ